MDGFFKHEWLLNNGIAFCHKTGLWWLLYEEGNGMFCLLCRMHDCENPFNKQKEYNQVPAVRYKKSALAGKDGHSCSWQHQMAIDTELNKQVSYFHKEYVITKNQKTKFCTMPFCQHIGYPKKELLIRSSSHC